MNKMLPSNEALYKQPSTRTKECGAALTELAISLPFLIMMFVGMFEVGRHLAQITSIVQTSFNAAYYGAGLQGSQTSMEQVIHDRAYFELYNIFHGREFNSDRNDFVVTWIPSVGAPPGSPNNNVRISFSSTMRDLLGPINQMVSLTQNVEFTLPMLVRQASPIDYNQFENAGDGLYDRFGNFYPGCHTCSCAGGCP